MTYVSMVAHSSPGEQISTEARRSREARALIRQPSGMSARRSVAASSRRRRVASGMGGRPTKPPYEAPVYSVNLFAQDRSAPRAGLLTDLLTDEPARAVIHRPAPTR